MAVCDVCFRKCDIPEGKRGWCRARGNEGGHIYPANYGVVTGLALDPIEKKPLSRFMPGSMILSVGSFGCNLDCPFCQNFEIARAFEENAASEDPDVLYSDEDGLHRINVRRMTPEELCALAQETRSQGNAGVAFTYNEPLVGWEFVRDTARLVRAAGMKNVLVSNGCVNADVAEEIIPLMDAANIDLKCFSEDGYKGFLGGDLELTKGFIRRAAGRIQLELTTLIIPGFNDTEEDMEREAEWIAGLDDGRGCEIPLHISRFFPRHRLTDRDATDVGLVYRLAEVARKYLKYVYTGNC